MNKKSETESPTIAKITDFVLDDVETFKHVNKKEYIARIKKSKHPEFKENQFVLVKVVEGVKVIAGKIILDKTFGDPKGFE